MSKKLPCDECGKFFYEKTLEKNNGICGRCSKKQIEQEDDNNDTLDILSTINEETPESPKAPSPTPEFTSIIPDMNPNQLLDCAIPDLSKSVYFYIDTFYYDHHDYGTGEFDHEKHDGPLSILEQNDNTKLVVCNSNKEEREDSQTYYYEFLGIRVEKGITVGSYSIFLRLNADDEKNIDFAEWL